jgi:hypothetical protein
MRNLLSGAGLPFMGTFVFGTLSTAVDGIVLLNSVADHLATTMSAHRRKGMDGTLERIERVIVPIHRDRKRLIVIVAAYFTCQHGSLLKNEMGNLLPRFEQRKPGIGRLRTQARNRNLLKRQREGITSDMLQT